MDSMSASDLDADELERPTLQLKRVTPEECPVPHLTTITTAVLLSLDTFSAPEPVGSLLQMPWDKPVRTPWFSFCRGQAVGHISKGA